jgi:acetyl-CoA carboxylase carboxyl transferase subunit beta
MAWWSRKRGLVAEPKKSVPKGVWIQCESCNVSLTESELDENLRVCPSCGHHSRFPTWSRIELIVDAESFEEADHELRSSDPLEFQVDGKKYRDSLKSGGRRADYPEAYIAGQARLGGHDVEVGFFVFEFMGGSMGSVVGEKITRQFERALERRCPAIVFSASGGARMQEGVLSLMQMAKTSAARDRLRRASIPYISVLLHPTTGGVAASFAMLGDLIIAEPHALIGFAGPRVIEQTIRQQLPEGFQRSEFLLDHGIIDVIAPRAELKGTLTRALTWFGGSANGVHA